MFFQLPEPMLTMLPPPRAHRGEHRLRGEEVRPQVDGDALVEIGGRDLLDAVALVVGDVVDQHVDAAHRFGQPRDRRLQRGHVGHVAGLEVHALQAGRQRGAGARIAVDEADAAALFGEGAHDVGADAAGAAGDDHALAAQAVERGAGKLHLRNSGHGSLLLHTGPVAMAARSSSTQRVPGSCLCASSWKPRSRASCSMRVFSLSTVATMRCVPCWRR